MKIPRLADTGEWTTRRYLSLLGSIVIWIIVAIDAWYLWPTQLGGATSIVIVSGESMEPTYFDGDLVIARTMEPGVGDVIIYAPEGLGGSQVVHRIIGGSAADGWQMQGDNNDFIDPFTPRGEEVKGVVLVHYSSFGRVTVLLLNPVVWALVLLVAMVLMLWYTGDDCDGDGDPESEVEEEPDLIDRVVEGTEAAVARMVASSARAGAATLALLTRPFPSPRFTSSAYLRGSAIGAVLGLVALFGPSTASASQLLVSVSGQASIITNAQCDDLTLSATTSGTGAGGAYTGVSVAGLSPNCHVHPMTINLHSSTGALMTTGSVPSGSATTIFTTPSYVAADVARAIVKIDGWVFVASWTSPQTGPITCQELTAWPGNASEAPPTYGEPTGNTCTVTYPPLDAWGGTPPKHFKFPFTVSGTSTGNWRVTIDFTDPYFQGLLPVSLGTHGNPLVSPGYACSQLPVFVAQTHLSGDPTAQSHGYVSGSSVGAGGSICP